MSREHYQEACGSVQAATAPCLCSIYTKSGCGSVAHALRGFTELNSRATVMSIEGISACDLISREAMLQALADAEGGSQALPFVSMFYGAPSEYLLEDSAGSAHHQTGGKAASSNDAIVVFPGPTLRCCTREKSCWHSWTILTQSPCQSA